MISIETSVPKSKVFRFENFWISHPGFFDLVKSTWEKYCYAPNSAKLLCKKFKNLRYALKRWSKQISRLNLCIDNSNWVLLELDNIEDKRPLTIPEANFRLILKNHMATLLGYKREYWKKRYTVRWFSCGGDNTKFFHSAASERYRKNSIASLKLHDGTVVTDHLGKANELFSTYMERLGTKGEFDMKFDLSRIIKKVEGLEELTTPFTHEEIDRVVREMPSDRAPGPDGFSGAFLKACWPLIKHDFYSLCGQFYEGRLDLTSINDGLITLIPKRPSRKTVKDYRPITLLNCYLKVITKILANRLQKVILKIVHKNQYGFLKGWTIQDCLAWAYEDIYQCQSSRKEIMLLKLDFAKAFDTIEHEAMIEIMKSMGFNDKWLGWIRCIFSSGKSSVLPNGTPGRQFYCKCGVRQGDPLSPLIFVLAADLLQAAINDAFTRNLIHLPFPSQHQNDYPVIRTRHHLGHASMHPASYNHQGHLK